MSEDSRGSKGGSGERSPLLTSIMDASQTVVYYGITFVLLATIAVLFVSVGATFLTVFEVDPLDTALAVLDRILLITIEVIVRERQLVAEPFLLIGVVAVVRRILLITAEAGQSLDDPERFRNLITELGVSTALVLALAIALYIARRTQRRQEDAS